MKTFTVLTSHRRRDGDWLVVTRCGANAVSPCELPEGARITIDKNGKAKRG